MQSQNEPSAMKVAIEICEEFAEHWEQQARSGDNTGASDHRADAARQIIAELRNVNTAPPAQPALTDDARDAFIRDVAAQKPEKPDHWSSCGQCGHNIERAQDLLDAVQSASGDAK